MQGVWLMDFHSLSMGKSRLPTIFVWKDGMFLKCFKDGIFESLSSDWSLYGKKIPALKRAQKATSNVSKKDLLSKTLRIWTYFDLLKISVNLFEFFTTLYQREQ